MTRLLSDGVAESPTGVVPRLGSAAPFFARRSPVGIGTWAAGDSGQPGRAGFDRHALDMVLRRGFELALDWIDTAPAYADGLVEEAVGAFLAGLPGDLRPAVITKGGVVRDLSRRRSRPTAVLRPSVLRAQLEGSLRRLRVSAVDAYLLHSPDETGVPVEESWGTVRELVREGKIRRAGLCGFSHSAVRRCAAEGHVDLLMCRLAPVGDGSCRALTELCRALGTELITWDVSDSRWGLDLTDPGPLSATPLDTPHHRLRQLADAPFGAELAVTAVLSDIARERRLPVAAVTVAWQLSWEAVGGVIIGATKPADLESGLAGSALRLSAEEVARIEEVAAWGSVGVGGGGPGSSHGPPARPAHGRMARRGMSP
jgi:aryl-alcohol dehydrogenase-like predicted oxidoreductase